MKKILFATDFSTNADKAFCFALNMAEKHQAELIMVHVFNTPSVWTYPNAYNPSEIKMHSKASWEHSLEEFFEHYDTEIKASFVAVDHHSVVKGILSVIEEQKPALVVTGTRGKSIIKEALFGSTTKALVEQSPIPVMAIPENAIQHDYNKVLYASDFREVDLEAIKKLVELVKPYTPEIKILHITTKNEYQGFEKMEWFEELIKDNIDYENMSFELVLSDDLFQALYKFMAKDDFDLLVMLEKERNGIFDQLFHEDLVKKMEFRTWIPLLSYNEFYLSVAGDVDVKKRDRIEH